MEKVDKTWDLATGTFVEQPQKEVGYDKYTRVKIVTDTAGTSGDEWWIGAKEEGGPIKFPGMGNAITTTGKLHIHTVPPDCKDLKDVKDMAQLLSEAGQSSLHDLCNLWQARWGTNWVKRGEIDGEFWEVAAARLHAAARLEAHVLADGTRVFKLDNE